MAIGQLNFYHIIKEKYMLINNINYITILPAQDPAHIGLSNMSPGEIYGMLPGVL